MITEKQARSIVESVMEELEESSMTGERDDYVEMKITDIGKLVETMLSPVTERRKT